MLHLVQALMQREGDDVPRLWVVTSAFQAIGSATSDAIAQSTLWGLGAVIAREKPKVTLQST